MNSKIAVCLEVGQDYRPKAEYSIRMLLEPLGLGPQFILRNELLRHGIYYGSSPSRLHSDIVKIPLSDHTEEFFNHFEPLNPDSIIWRNHSDWNYPILFSSEQGDDLVASAFYWLSGWQEYTSSQRDQHGRFPHKASLQHSLETTCIPVVDIYREVLQNKLTKVGVHLQPKTWAGNRWALCPTIDVDYLKHWRPGMIYRELILYFLLNRRGGEFRARWKRLFQFIVSFMTPGDAFQKALRRMNQLIRMHGRATIFLKTDAHGPNDVGYKLNQQFLYHALSDLQSDQFEIGLHPSYHAHAHPDYLSSERRMLTNLIGIPPMSVRQHYLRYEPRITPALQNRAGFRIDSTLGFSECAGFRNGTCMPFLKFDCAKNKILDLWEMPLIIMDGTLFNRQNLKAPEAISHSIQLLKICQQFGGVGVVLWHNVIGEEMDYPEWGLHFERMIQWSGNRGAYISSLGDALSSWLKYPI